MKFSQTSRGKRENRNRTKTRKLRLHQELAGTVYAPTFDRLGGLDFRPRFDALLASSPPLQALERQLGEQAPRFIKGKIPWRTIAADIAELRAAWFAAVDAELAKPAEHPAASTAPDAIFGPSRAVLPQKDPYAPR